MESKVYRIYDPVSEKYIRRLSSGGNYTRPVIDTSRNPGTILNLNNVINIFKEFLKIQMSAKSKLPDSDSKKLRSVDSRKAHIKEIIEIMNRIVLQEIEFTPKTENLEIQSSGILKKKVNERLLKEKLIEKFEHNIADWFIKFSNSKSKKKIEPYCILASGYYYSQKNSSLIFDTIRTAESNGIKIKQVNSWASEILLYSEEDYNLFRLTISPDIFSKQVLFKDLVKVKTQVDNLAKKKFK